MAAFFRFKLAPVRAYLMLPNTALQTAQTRWMAHMCCAMCASIDCAAAERQVRRDYLPVLGWISTLIGINKA